MFPRGFRGGIWAGWLRGPALTTSSLPFSPDGILQASNWMSYPSSH